MAPRCLVVDVQVLRNLPHVGPPSICWRDGLPSGVVGIDLGVVGAILLDHVPLCSGARIELTRDHSVGVGDLDSTLPSRIVLVMRGWVGWPPCRVASSWAARPSPRSGGLERHESQECRDGVGHDVDLHDTWSSWPEGSGGPRPGGHVSWSRRRSSHASSDGHAWLQSDRWAAPRAGPKVEDVGWFSVMVCMSSYSSRFLQHCCPKKCIKLYHWICELLNGNTECSHWTKKTLYLETKTMWHQQQSLWIIQM